MVEITGNVFEGRVRDPRTPAEIEGPQLPQVLGDELDAVVGDLRAAREGQHCQIR